MEARPATLYWSISERNLFGNLFGYWIIKNVGILNFTGLFIFLMGWTYLADLLAPKIATRAIPHWSNCNGSWRSSRNILSICQASAFKKFLSLSLSLVFQSSYYNQTDLVNIVKSRRACVCVCVCVCCEGRWRHHRTLSQLVDCPTW